MSTDDSAEEQTSEKSNEEGDTKTFRKVGLLDWFKNRDKQDPNQMHFLEHLEEFRWVLLKSILTFLIGCIAVGVLMTDALDTLRRPLLQAIDKHGAVDMDLRALGLKEYIPVFEKEGVGLADLREAAREGDDEKLEEWGVGNPKHREQILVRFNPENLNNRKYLAALTPFAVFTVFIQVCFLGGIGLSLPFVMYFVAGFVLPGLTQKEKRVLLPGCTAAFFLFIAGACMTYFLVLPYSLYFSIMLSQKFGMEWFSGAGPYYSTVVWMTVAIGIAFEFPLILVLLSWIGILPVAKLKKNRRMVFVILMVAAALITPGGDPVTLMILTLPMYVLYETSIIVAGRLEKAKEKRKKEEAET